MRERTKASSTWKTKRGEEYQSLSLPKLSLSLSDLVSTSRVELPGEDEALVTICFLNGLNLEVRWSSVTWSSLIV